MQIYSSRSTSINSRKLPKIYSTVSFGFNPVLDYGAGRYTGHIKRWMEGEYLPFDPFNQTHEVNAQTLRRVRKAIADQEPLMVICSNVLNVINDDDVVQKIADRITYIAKKTGGRAYVTVYEGNKSGIGRQTGIDQYQRNEPLKNYLRFFKNARMTYGMIVVE